MKIAVLGAGAWGTALAVSLSAAHTVTLWGRAGTAAARWLETRRSAYLPEVAIPPEVVLTTAFDEALAGTDLAIVATPTAALVETCHALARQAPALPFLWACKGFDAETARLPHEIVREAHPRATCGALSGPSFALEVARGQPTAVVIAASDARFAAVTAAALNGPRLRIYSSDDLAGVELGGALKNVVAIAAGIADGLGLGRNARAALITRGLAEIVRLGTALGGRAETFMGLTGLGDLVLTCTGDLSRNREVGVAIARGATLDEALARLGHVAEGVRSARAARQLAHAHHTDMPIVEAVCEVLFEAARPDEAVRRLLARDPKPER